MDTFYICACVSLFMPVSLSASKDVITNSDGCSETPHTSRAKGRDTDRVKGGELGKVSLKNVTPHQFSLGPTEAQLQGLLQKCPYDICPTSTIHIDSDVQLILKAIFLT